MECNIQVFGQRGSVECICDTNFTIDPLTKVLLLCNTSLLFTAAAPDCLGKWYPILHSRVYNPLRQLFKIRQIIVLPYILVHIQQVKTIFLKLTWQPLIQQNATLSSERHKGP